MGGHDVAIELVQVQAVGTETIKGAQHGGGIALAAKSLVDDDAHLGTTMDRIVVVEFYATHQYIAGECRQLQPTVDKKSFVDGTEDNRTWGAV
ncbi:MAG: hypothetical protein AUK63_1117 [bacterium P3]|nr:MAG: hypothetical protein AUK63_1117 [bacterium P3]KWW40671.1 MAG: hypothetical protein F083_1465 [bacterium F083]